MAALPMMSVKDWWTPAEEYFLVNSDYNDFVLDVWIQEWEFPDVWAPPPHGNDLEAFLLRSGVLRWGPETKAGDGTEWRHDRFKRRRWPPGDGNEYIGDAVPRPIDYEQAVAWVRAHDPGESKPLRAVRRRSDARWSWLSNRAQERRLLSGVGHRGAGPGNDAERRRVDRALQVAFLVYAGLIATRASGVKVSEVHEDGTVEFLRREEKSACDAVAAAASHGSPTYETIEKNWLAYKPYFPFRGMTLREGEVYAQQRRGFRPGRPGEDTSRRIQHESRIESALLARPDAVRQIEEEFRRAAYKR